MNFFNLRKYFFANISALWGFVVIYAIIMNNKADYPPPAPNDVIAIGGIEFFAMILSIFILLCIFIFFILEILIRKYIIEKKFPHFKLNIKIKIPKVMNIIYNIIFVLGFISSVFISSIILFFLVIHVLFL